MNNNFTRKDVTFSSQGTDCSAWLYTTESDSKAPIIVMAHGLGGTKEMGLDDYAEKFAKAGYSCFLFDYKNFGASGGEERQNLNVKSQLADWDSAIAHVKASEDIDSEKIALFGSSFSGGHVLRVAEKHQDVVAVISQCPFTSGIASSLVVNPFSSIKVTNLAIADVLSRMFGFGPVMVKLAGENWSTALMPVDDHQGMNDLIPEVTNYKPEVWAYAAFQVLSYHPGKAAKNVKCPVYFAICDPDSVAPSKTTAKYAAQAPKGEVVHYPYGHFEIYKGEPYEKASTDYVNFLNKAIS